MNEKIQNSEVQIANQDPVNRVGSISVTGELQISPIELQARGEGTNEPSVDQKM